MRSLEKLTDLFLNKTRITDEHAAQLSELTSVALLRLSETPLTDAAVVHLVRMPHLEELALDRTMLTDTGLTQLVQMPQLRSLDVSYSQMTAEAADQVREKHLNLNLIAPTNDRAGILYRDSFPASAQP